MKKNICLFILFLFSYSAYSQCFKDRHSTLKSDAWETCTTQANPNSAHGNSQWIMYDLGDEYPLSSLHIWNYNHPENLTKGVKTMAIDYSTNGNNWTSHDVVGVAQATGSSFYEGSEVSNLGGVMTRFVLLTFLENWGDSDCVGFGEVRIGIGDNRPAMELFTFNANCDRRSGNVNINWGTRFETRSDYFELERSSDGNNWIRVTSIDSKGISDNPNRYKYRDIKYYNGDNYYRLVHHDGDGNTIVSDPIMLECFRLIRVEIFPNPITDNLNMRFEMEGDALLDYTITDALGKVMMEGQFNAYDGTSEFQIKDLKLIPGNYVLQIIAGGATIAKPIVVVD